MHDRRYGQEAVARLHATAERLLAELDLETLLTIIVSAGAELLRCRKATLRIVDGQGNVEREIRAGEAGGFVDGDAPTHSSESTDRTSLTRDVGVGGIRFGVLSFVGPHAGGFTEEDVDIADAFAATAAIAWQNALRHGKALREVRAAVALNMLITPMISADAEEIIQVAAQGAFKIVPATFVSIVCPREDSGMLVVRGAVGPHADEIRGIAYPADGTLAGRALATGRVAVAVGPIEFLTASGPLRLAHVVAVPLLDGERRLGVIHLGRDHRSPLFSHAEIDTVATFASAAAEIVGRLRKRPTLREVTAAVAEERSRIARDIHDTVIQRLFATGLGLQAIAVANPLIDDVIEAQTSQIDAAIGELRSTVSRLVSVARSDRPEDVRDRVVQELSDLAATAGATHRVVFAVPPDQRLSPALIDDILAVVREGSSNVLRHAQSRWSEVTVVIDQTTATVCVEDDGVGIDVGAHRRSGIGNMEERALRHGGSFVVRPREEGGTLIRWRVPLGAEPVQT
ncbi:sensor histidine kinase [Microbacterium sp. 2RAF4]|uniref:sensor histidine kinase n=1 Tax=Microbacterium sp. 2RAF4 TaxID=3232999 RepID=UPI003F9D0E75